MHAVQSTDGTKSDVTEPDWPRPSEEPAPVEIAQMPGCVLSGHPSPEEVIPQICYLAQHVGGLQRLAEIIAELQGESLE